MDDKRSDIRKGRSESLNSLVDRPDGDRQSRPDATADDFWPVLVEFALSLRGWWIAICDDLDLTPMQGQSLKALDPDRPVAMSVLADALICDASNVTGIVDKLESRGLIIRQGAENDRRIKMLAVTPAGRQLREQLIARSQVPPAAVSAMPVAARRELAEVLRAIADERFAAAG
jgi:MarR family transcriptional regulator, organic hydroperoxide resistance regulator